MILFPTDLSEQSSVTFGFALAFAKKLQMEITLIHVYRVPVINAASMELGSDIVTDEMAIATEIAAENRLKQFKDTLAQKYVDSYPEKIRVNGMLRMGFKGEEICRAAEEIHASYIILSVNRSTGIDKFISTNTVMPVINKSKVPVITVPEHYEFKDFHKIAYATDLTFSDNEMISRLLSLAKTMDATIKCFHVHDSKLEIENSIIDDFIQQYRAEANAGLITFKLVDNLNVLDGIDYYVKEQSIDLLCVMKQKHYWLDFFEKKITKQLVFHEEIPMLIYHE